MNVTFNYGYWSLWALYQKVVFDGVNRIIYVNEEVTELDIKIDVYSNWKEWTITYPENAGWLPAIRAVGGDPTIAGQYAGDIYFLINGWKLYVDLTKVRITGTLFSDNYASAYYTYAGVIQYPAQVSSLVTGSAQIANSDSISNSLSTIQSTTTTTNATVNSISSSNATILAKVLEVWQLMGLDLSNPKTITDSSITVGGITLTIGQPTASSTTVTRNS
jgi:hypothetical protein